MATKSLFGSVVFPDGTGFRIGPTEGSHAVFNHEDVVVQPIEGVPAVRIPWEGIKDIEVSAPTTRFRLGRYLLWGISLITAMLGIDWMPSGDDVVVVVNRKSGVPVEARIWGKAGNGYDPEDLDRLRAVLSAAVSNPAMRSRLGDALRS